MKKLLIGAPRLKTGSLPKYSDADDYFWKIQTRTLDFGFGDSWEWKILAEGKEESLIKAKSAIKEWRPK